MHRLYLLKQLAKWTKYADTFNLLLMITNSC